MKITVIGTGYTALAEAAVLCCENDVKILSDGDIDKNVLVHAAEYGQPDLASHITDDVSIALEGAEIVFISNIVSYDTELNMYDTHDMDMYINLTVRTAPQAAIVLRSDVPVGYTDRIRQRYPETDISFVPDFSKEGSSLQDAFHPSRLVIGGGSPELQEQIVSLLGRSCEVVVTDSNEAESVKLFANAYLAMRVAYFNELDTYAELRGLDAQAIIKSVSLDPRVGDLYNNPSFGYGGRYLVEGTCRLRHDFADIPERIVDVVEVSNEVRKAHIADMIMERKPTCCGIYGLSMKTGSKDFRCSAVEGVIKRLQARGVRVVIFEPMINTERYLSSDVIADFDIFCEMSDVIVANRVDARIKKYREKLYTRDIFERD
ncbi:UDP binding domain-containing protein [Gallibacter sp. Marseille-QA0791]|uniref:UDP binding domain-containing protein n=1 Tax=Gallibacter sp. Marseille-QA0791 TaxID=3378781 RepID=UPI003D1231C5